MSDFQKSGINFSFQDASWAVVKYNEHVAHRQVEKVLKPTKAVDHLIPILNNIKTPDLTFLGVKSGVYFVKH